MKEYYIWFLNKFNFPNAAVRDLIVFYEQIQADDECYNELMGIVDRYRQDINADVLQMINDVKSLSWTNAVHPFTRALIMLILMSKYLKERYEEKGLPLDVWENSMKDLLYKCIECRLVYGIWGVFADWFGGFYHLTRFALGRLQFDVSNSPIDYAGNKITLKKGDKLLRVHIPRTGARLERDKQVESYRLAADFFKPFFGDDKIVFTCESWLLFPAVKQMLSPQSNLFAFISDYELIDSGYYDDFFSWAWRLYDTKEQDIDKLPQNTSLRKKYIDYVKSGKKSGWGYGAFVYSDANAEA